MFEKFKPYHKSVIAMLFDVCAAAFFLPLSFYIRLDQNSYDYYINKDLFNLWLTITVIQFLTFKFYGLYKGIWRYSSTQDLVRLIKGISAAIFFSILYSFFYNRLDGIPRSIFFIDWLLLLVGLGGGRLGYRVLREWKQFKSPDPASMRKVLIIGAGAAGEQIIREIRRTITLNMDIVGILDDDKSKIKRSLQGISVLGSIEDAQFFIDKFSIDTVIIAIPSANSSDMARILTLCNQTAGVIIKTLPKVSDILSNKPSLSQLRNLEPEDLLGREAIELNKEPIKEMIHNSIIMVTGAGGSIGSELVHQIAKFDPSTIILFDTSEYNLYNLDYNLKIKFPALKYKLIIGDIRDKLKVENIISSYSPSIIFHAAAYKHVPMMEQNPSESVLTNIIGTQIVAEAAQKYGVSKFVMVSTDKAVRPTNVMGATKRGAELFCQSLQPSSTTQYIIVRFGNVLGSSGSVIPLFKKQIQAGGPITVTHPDVTRYFMSIPEACQLVLLAGSEGKGGEIFLLDMGKSVKIVDLARNMINLSGFSINQIKIEFIGLRPGEKLYEELLLDCENTQATSHPSLKIAKSSPTNTNVQVTIDELKQMISNFSSDGSISEKLKALVPEYTPRIHNDL